MGFSPGLKLTGAAVMFVLGLALHGDWKESVLGHHTSNCGFFPCGLRSYPYALARLANGKPTVQGFKELFPCAPEPGWEFVQALRSKQIARGTDSTEMETVDDGRVFLFVVVEHCGTAKMHVRASKNPSSWFWMDFPLQPSQRTEFANSCWPIRPTVSTRSRVSAAKRHKWLIVPRRRKSPQCTSRTLRARFTRPLLTRDNENGRAVSPAGLVPAWQRIWAYFVSSSGARGGARFEPCCSIRRWPLWARRWPDRSCCCFWARRSWTGIG